MSSSCWFLQNRVSFRGLIGMFDTAAPENLYWFFPSVCRAATCWVSAVSADGARLPVQISSAISGGWFVVVLCHFSPGLYTDVVFDFLRTTSRVGRSNVTCRVCWKNCRPADWVKMGSTPNCLCSLVPGLEAGVLRTVALPFCLGIAACVDWSGRLPLGVCVCDI